MPETVKRKLMRKQEFYFEKNLCLNLNLNSV